jgi:tRNA threonylcarbamoyladenosine dehydratase
VTAYDRDGFYRELTVRNGGLIPESSQRRLRQATVLVAGCGSTGGAAIEPLVRLGAERMVLADNGDFELNNLNRQPAGLDDLGRNKALVARSRVAAINPHAEIAVETAGVTPENVERLVMSCDAIVDGVDVTDKSGWRAKLLLHQAAAAQAKPVITGYDMAGLQYMRFYDYRRVGSVAFDGRINSSHVESLDSWALLVRVIPIRRVPFEMLAEARAHLGQPEYSVSQLVYASLLFGALCARMVSEVVSGGQVRREVVVDVHREVRTPADRVRVAARHALELAAAAADIVRLRRQARIAAVAALDPARP